jgi:hypothetical protein
MAPFCLGRLSTRAATFLGRLFDRRLMAAKDDYGDASHRSALATFRPPQGPDQSGLRVSRRDGGTSPHARTMVMEWVGSDDPWLDPLADWAYFRT